jgi:hypothetical protein
MAAAESSPGPRKAIAAAPQNIGIIALPAKVNPA